MGGIEKNEGGDNGRQVEHAVYSTGGDEENQQPTTSASIDASIAKAKDYAEAEHTLTPLQAIKAYPTSILWCLALSTCLIMEGYDTILIGNFFAFPAFAKKYGQAVDQRGNWQLSAAWQAGLGNASATGAFVGSLLNGVLVARFGQKRVVVSALAVMSCFILVTFFADHVWMLLLGQLLCGVPWGVFATSAPAYASEVLPLALRVYFTSYANTCFIIGQLVAAGVLASLVGRGDEWAYRIPFALQWTWPAVLIPLLCFAPESPWHLVRVGRLDEAERMLRKLARKNDPNADPKATLAGIVHTNELEQRLTSGTSYLDCFRGDERRRTEIACVVFAGQVLGGSSFAYNSTYFFQQVGIPASQSYKVNIGGKSLALVGSLISWFGLMPYLGRRTIFLFGMFAMSSLLFLVGILARWTDTLHGFAIAQAVLTLAWIFVYQLSVGQLGWAIPAEVGSTRVRQKTVCVARNAYYAVSIVSLVIQPYLLNPTELNLRGYVGFVYGTTALLTWLWAYFRLPETKGRTYAELDWLFAEKTPTRAFKTAEISVFDLEEREEPAGGSLAVH